MLLFSPAFGIYEGVHNYAVIFSSVLSVPRGQGSRLFLASVENISRGGVVGGSGGGGGDTLINIYSCSFLFDRTNSRSHKTPKTVHTYTLNVRD